MQKNFKAYELIKAVTDSDSFIETLSLVKGKSSLGEAAGEGVISGFAAINDIQIGVFAGISEVLNGSIGKKGAKKISSLIETAVKTGSPIIGFLDSEGARFAEGIKAMEGYAAIFQAFNQAAGVVPTILIVSGKSYGMLTYLLGACDVAIAYNDSKIATQSPLILAANTKKDVSEVASAQIHNKGSGIISHIVNNAEELKTLLDKILNTLINHEEDCTDDPNRVCRKLKAESKVNEVISEAFDAKSFIEIKGGFANEVITGFARLNGSSVGIIANNGQINEGRLSSNGAYKITSFLNTCLNFGLPIINIVDSCGAVNNLNDENGRLIKDISDMLLSYNIFDKCKVSLIIKNAIGLGYVAFANKRIMDYTIAWEDARISMLNDTATATLLFSDLMANSQNKDALTQELAQSYGKENSSAHAVAAEGYIDNVISPQLTRQYLIAAVRAFKNK